MSRFVSFVNDPDVADPTVTFTERAGRKVPVPIGMPKFQPLQADNMTLVDDLKELDTQDDSLWTMACAYDYLIPCRGVGVLLADGSQVALFRLDDGSLRAVGNIDPFSGAAVMSRGIVGDRGGRPTVQSPIKKQALALDDGRCLDAPRVAVPVYPTRVTAEGYVEVAGWVS